jgi:hypothetical protein
MSGHIASSFLACGVSWPSFQVISSSKSAAFFLQPSKMTFAVFSDWRSRASKACSTMCW